MSRAARVGDAAARRMPPVIHVVAPSAFALGFTEFVTIGLVPAISASRSGQSAARSRPTPSGPASARRS